MAMFTGYFDESGTHGGSKVASSYVVTWSTQVALSRFTSAKSVSRSAFRSPLSKPQILAREFENYSFALAEGGTIDAHWFLKGKALLK